MVALRQKGERLLKKVDRSYQYNYDIIIFYFSPQQKIIRYQIIRYDIVLMLQSLESINWCINRQVLYSCLSQVSTHFKCGPGCCKPPLKKSFYWFILIMLALLMKNKEREMVLSRLILPNLCDGSGCLSRLIVTDLHLVASTYKYHRP